MSRFTCSAFLTLQGQAAGEAITADGDVEHFDVVEYVREPHPRAGRFVALYAPSSAHQACPEQSLLGAGLPAPVTRNGGMRIRRLTLFSGRGSSQAEVHMRQDFPASAFGRSLISTRHAE